MAEREKQVVTVLQADDPVSAGQILQLVGSHDDGAVRKTRVDAFVELRERKTGSPLVHSHQGKKDKKENQTKIHHDNSSGVTYQMATDVRIDGTQRIVQQNNLRVAIYSPSQCDTLLLAAAEVHAALTDLCLVAGAEDRKICKQQSGERKTETLRRIRDRDRPRNEH